MQETRQSEKPQGSIPLSFQLMSEFLAGYKQTEPFRSAKKIGDNKRAIGEMYARATWGEEPMARWSSPEAKKRLERAYYGKAGLDRYQDLREHPEKIYEEMQEVVKDNLHGPGLEPNAWLTLKFLAGKEDAIQFISAWEPVGKEYGNAIMKALIDEDLAENGESLNGLMGRLKKAETSNRKRG